MIKLQFKLPQALISRGFTRRTVFHAPAFQQKGINRLMDIYLNSIEVPSYEEVAKTINYMRSGDQMTKLVLSC